MALNRCEQMESRWNRCAVSRGSQEMVMEMVIINIIIDFIEKGNYIREVANKRENVSSIAWRSPTRVLAVLKLGGSCHSCHISSVSWPANVSLNATALNLRMVNEMR